MVFTSRHYTRLVRGYGLRQEKFITPHCVEIDQSPSENGEWKMKGILVWVKVLALLAFGWQAAADERVGANVEIIPDQYIVIFKSLDMPADIAPESTRQRAELLMLEVQQHERDLHKTSREPFSRIGFVYKHNPIGFSARLSPEAVELLTRNPQIDYIVPDGVVRDDMVVFEPWGLDRVDQRFLPLDHSYDPPAQGDGVHVYIIDSGIRATHVEFQGRIGVGYDFIDNDANPNDPCNGHGVHVTGTIGGESYGVARGVTLHPLRVSNCDGSGSFSDLMSALDWILDHVEFPAVINISMSGGTYQPMDDKVNNTVAAGIAVVVSAGNDSGDACLRSPARATRAITVGASDHADDRRSSSSFGSCVDIFAPGEATLSAEIDSDIASGYRSGTSMAAPHVTGVAAMYLELYPDATSSDVTAAILLGSTAGVIGNAGSGSPNRLLYSNLEWIPVQRWLVPILDLILQ